MKVSGKGKQALNESKMVLLLMKGAISDMESEDRDDVFDCVKELKEVISKYGKMGDFACGLIGAEIAAGKFTGGE